MIPGFLRTLVVGLGREQAPLLMQLAERQQLGTKCILMVPPLKQDFSFRGLQIEVGDEAAIASLEGEFLRADLVIILADIEDQTILPLIDALPNDEDSGAVRISITRLLSRDLIPENAYAKKLIAILKKKSDSVMVIEDHAHRKLFGASILNESQESHNDHILHIIMSVVEALAAERGASNSSAPSLRSTLESAGLALASFRMFGPDYGIGMLKEALSSSVSPYDIRNASHAFVLVHGPIEPETPLENIIHDLVSQALGSEIDVNAQYIASSSYGSPGRFLVLLAGLQDDRLIDCMEELLMDIYQMEKNVGADARIELDLPLHQLEDY